MKKVVAAALLSVSSFTVLAQAKPEWNEIFNRINTEVQSSSKAYSTLGDATKTIGHRLTGSENGKKAEQYAFDLLKSYGFKDVRFQPFSVESWSRNSLQVSIGANAGELKLVKAVSLAHSPV